MRRLPNGHLLVLACAFGSLLGSQSASADLEEEFDKFHFAFKDYFVTKIVDSMSGIGETIDPSEFDSMGIPFGCTATHDAYGNHKLDCVAYVFSRFQGEQATYNAYLLICGDNGSCQGLDSVPMRVVLSFGQLQQYDQFGNYASCLGKYSLRFEDLLGPVWLPREKTPYVSFTNVETGVYIGKTSLADIKGFFEAAVPASFELPGYTKCPYGSWPEPFRARR
jgi:hypothetical protein